MQPVRRARAAAALDRILRWRADAILAFADAITRKGKVYAERVVMAYLHRYAKKALADKDYEKLARIHNGGPRGHTKRATIKYWAKVEKALASQK